MAVCRKFTEPYLKAYWHLCAEKAFVPVGSVCNVYPSSVPEVSKVEDKIDGSPAEFVGRFRRRELSSGSTNRGTPRAFAFASPVICVGDAKAEGDGAQGGLVHSQLVSHKDSLVQPKLTRPAA